MRRLMGTCKSMEPSEGLVTPRTGARRTLGIPSPQSEGTTSIDYASLRTPRACPSPQSEGATSNDFSSLGTPRAYGLSRPTPQSVSGLHSALTGASNSSPQSSPSYPMSPSSSSSPNARHLPAAPGMQTSSPAYPISPSPSSQHARHLPAAPGMQTPKSAMTPPQNQAEELSEAPPCAMPGSEPRLTPPCAMPGSEPRQEEEENHPGNVTPRGKSGKKLFGSFRKAIKGAFGRRRSKQIEIAQDDAN